MGELVNKKRHNQAIIFKGLLDCAGYFTNDFLAFLTKFHTILIANQVIRDGV